MLDGVGVRSTSGLLNYASSLSLSSLTSSIAVCTQSCTRTVCKPVAILYVPVVPSDHGAMATLGRGRPFDLADSLLSMMRLVEKEPSCELVWATIRLQYI